jgi:WD40 repeat protein
MHLLSLLMEESWHLVVSFLFLCVLHCAQRDAGGDGIINLWDIGSGKKLRTFTGHVGPVWSLNFSNEGTVLASGSGDRSVKIWNTEKV